ncbi:MAG: hypothetical protein ATN35_06405 [Epulopiscium sp. Nele67-Bin004]|nr:MAG: hypothetical protein ATN35_06405 [Epulopiscium sp. Nele67-Bin004]
MTLLLILVLIFYTLSAPQFYAPTYEQINIEYILQQDFYSDADYETLYLQTGITKSLIDEIKNRPNYTEEMLSLQHHYFNDIDVIETAMNALTKWDQVFFDEEVVNAFELAPYQNGYIFLTKSTKTLGVRHGHAAIVVDAENGLVLESLEPGTVTVLQNADRWELYPTFIMLKPVGFSQEKLDEVAKYALENFMDIPYFIFAIGENSKTTQCSHIVWQIYKQFGIDIDDDGGPTVWPRDIARSDNLEVLQVFGFDLQDDRLW